MIYGWGTKIKKDLFIGRYYCETCGGFTNYYVVRHICYISLFFIPVLWYTKGYFIQCDSCERGRAIAKEEFETLKQQFQNFLSEGQVTDIVQLVKDEIVNDLTSAEKDRLYKEILENMLCKSMRTI